MQVVLQDSFRKASVNPIFQYAKTSSSKRIRSTMGKIPCVALHRQPSFCNLYLSLLPRPLTAQPVDPQDSLKCRKLLSDDFPELKIFFAKELTHWLRCNDMETR